MHAMWCEGGFNTELQNATHLNVIIALFTASGSPIVLPLLNKSICPLYMFDKWNMQRITHFTHTVVEKLV